MSSKYIRIKHVAGDDDENELPTKYDLEEKHGLIFRGPASYYFDFEPCASGNGSNTSSKSKKKVVYMVLALSEFIEEANDHGCNDDGDDDHGDSEKAETKIEIESEMMVREAPQAGTAGSGNYDDNDTVSSVELSSRSICTGTYAENLEDVFLVQPTPKTRSDKTVFPSTAKGVNAKYKYKYQKQKKISSLGLRCSMSPSASASTSTVSSVSPQSPISTNGGFFNTCS